MPEIHYKAFGTHLKNAETEGYAPVYLIYGEEALYKTVLNNLLDAMIPGPTRTFNYDPIDEKETSIFDAIERLNTFSLVSGLKVVALCDSRIFDSNRDKGSLLEKAKEACEKNDLQQSSRYLISLLGLTNLSFSDIDGENRREALNLVADKYDDDGDWLDKVIGYCISNNMSIGSGGDDAGAVERAIEKGFPKGHHLVITTDLVDKRRSLYKTIKNKGVVVDCSVPKGERKEAKTARDSVLRDRMKTVLSRSKKTIAGDAFRAMVEMTGFDLPTFSNNLEKLVSYIGDRKQITIHDVASVLERTKKDPIFELTGSISDRSIEEAFFYLDSLLSSGFHPLQILAAIVNQIRRLLVIKGFLEHLGENGLGKSLSYSQFTRRMMPEIQAYDEDFLNQLNKWESLIEQNDHPAPENNEKERKKKKRSKPISDLVIAKDPKNTYPIYQNMMKSEKFTKDDLFCALESLKEADRLLKSSGQNPKLILEKTILAICRP